MHTLKIVIMYLLLFTFLLIKHFFKCLCFGIRLDIKHEYLLKDTKLYLHTNKRKPTNQQSARAAYSICRFSPPVASCLKTTMAQKTQLQPPGARADN